jgi:zinc protease
MKHLFFSCISAVLASLVLTCTLGTETFAQSQNRLQTSSIQDSAVLVGTLPNGFRYYIRKNTKPEKRVEMRLAVDVGSVYEDDDQQGLAHFVEHCAFNGTQHFPKRALVNALERLGMVFGAHTNAYTNFEETVYKIQVPTTDTAALRTGVQILRDWATGISFDTTEINKERGVVVEEWRLQEQGLAGRFRRQILPILFDGLIHHTRLPIGKKAVIDTCRIQRVRDFYARWYLPRRMSAIVVGDISPKIAEKMLAEYFSDMDAAHNNTNSDTITLQQRVKPNATPHVAVVIDKEITSSSIEMIWKHEIPFTSDVSYRRQEIYRAVLTQLINNRFSDILRANPTHPVNTASVGANKQTRLLTTMSLNVEAKHSVIGGFEAALAEIERVRRFGFLDTEIQRIKTNLLEGIAQQFSQRETFTSAYYADVYVEHALGQGAIRSAEEQYRVDKEILSTLNPATIHTFAQEMFRDSNRIVLCSYPEREGMRVPERKEFLDAIAKVRTDTLQAYRETFTDTPLLVTEPRKGRIVKTRRIKPLGVTEWECSNGTRIVLKPTTAFSKKDEILMQSFVEGGSSQFATPENYLALLQTEAMQSPSVSGIGMLSGADFDKKMTGKVASVTPDIWRYFHGFKGSTRAASADLTTFFQLLHASFTRPRLDTAAFRMQQFTQGLAALNRGASPDAVFNDSVRYIFNKYHFTAKPSTKADFDAWNHANTSFPYFQKLVSNARGMTFVFVGRLTEAAMKPFVEKYIASLPSTQERTRWKDLKDSTARGIQREIYAGMDDKSAVFVAWQDTCAWSPELAARVDVANDILQVALSDALREDSSGVYYVAPDISLARIPHTNYYAQVYFPCAPARAKPLIAHMHTILEELANARFEDRYLRDAKAKCIAIRQTNRAENTFWLEQLTALYQYNDKHALLLEYEKYIKAVQKSDVASMIRSWMQRTNAAEFILFPAKK